MSSRFYRALYLSVTLQSPGYPHVSREGFQMCLVMVCIIAQWGAMNIMRMHLMQHMSQYSIAALSPIANPPSSITSICKLITSSCALESAPNPSSI